MDADEIVIEEVQRHRAHYQVREKLEPCDLQVFNVVIPIEDAPMYLRRRVASAALMMIAISISPSLGQEGALVNGEVTKIDEPAGKVTIKHGPIAGLALNEDGKTDDFRPKDGLLFNALKVGD